MSSRSQAATAQKIVDLLATDPGVATLGGIGRGLYLSAYRTARPCERCSSQFTPARNNPHARFCSSDCYKASLRADYHQARHRPEPASAAT